MEEADARDRALLAAHVRGDRDAFGELVARHRDRLYAVALRTLAGPGPDPREEAADALQDALVSALRGAASFRGDARVSTWLHRIVVNACLDVLRRRAARPTGPLPDQEPVAPGDALADRETTLDVRAALARLPVEQRVALVLVDLAGLPVAEAAAVLEVPVGTVTSRCSRGRARMAVALGQLSRADQNNGGRNRPAAAPVDAGEGNGPAAAVPLGGGSPGQSRLGTSGRPRAGGGS